MKLSNYLLFFLMISTALASAVAQTGPSAPESTEIVVPEVIVDLEDPEPEAIDPSIPDLADRTLFLDSDSSLDSLDLLQIDQNRYRELLSASSDLGAVPNEAPQSVYTQGTVGLGLHQYLMGQVSIYQLGESPELRLEFDFESSDGGFVGTDLVEAGEGMYHQDVSMEGSVDLPFETSQLHIRGNFRKFDMGLQNLFPGFYSASSQFLGVQPVFTLAIDQVASFELGAEYRYGRRFYSSTGAGGSEFDQSEHAGDFYAAIHLEPENLAFDAAFAYQLRVAADGKWRHRLVPELALYAEPLETFSLLAEVGLLAELGNSLELPFLLGFDIIPDEFFALEVRGGYRLEEQDLARLWLDYPALSEEVPATQPYNAYWLASVAASFWPADVLELRVGAEFRSWRRRFTLGAVSVADAAINWGWDHSVLNELIPRVGLDLRPSESFLVSLAWQGSFSDAGFGVQTVALRAELREPSSLYGGIAEVQFRVDGGLQMPNLSLGGWVSLADLVQLELRIIDPLALLVPDGRNLYSGTSDFKQQGFRFEFLASVSL